MSDIDVVIAGRKFKDMSDPHVTTIWVHGHAEELRRQGHNVRYLEWDKDDIEAPNVLMMPGWQMPGGKYVLRTLHYLGQCRERKLVMVHIDIELMEEYSKLLIRQKYPKIGLISNFRTPEAFWQVPSQFHEFSPWDPSEYLIKESKTLFSPIKFPLVYVGAPKWSRWRTLRTIDANLTMVGINTDRQDKFKYYDAKGVGFRYLGSLYTVGAWHLVVADDEINKAQVAASRMAESWTFGRPCIWHRSAVESRPDVNWEKVKTFIIDKGEQADIIARTGLLGDGTYSEDALRGIAEYQRSVLYDQFYSKAPVVKQTSEFFS